MPPQINTLSKSRRTKRTLERMFSRVDQPVPGQIILHAKRRAAVRADVGTFSGVGASVPGERRLLDESGAADVAGIRFLLHVNSLVRPQVGDLTKRVFANRTLVGFLPRVDAFMNA